MTWLRHCIKRIIFRHQSDVKLYLEVGFSLKMYLGHVKVTSCASYNWLCHWSKVGKTRVGEQGISQTQTPTPPSRNRNLVNQVHLCKWNFSGMIRVAALAVISLVLHELP